MIGIKKTASCDGLTDQNFVWPIGSLQDVLQETGDKTCTETVYKYSDLAAISYSLNKSHARKPRATKTNDRTCHQNK